MNLKKEIIVVLTLLPILSLGQSWCNFEKEAVKQRMYQNIAVLSHDSLGGREAGTLYELKAARYIAGIYETIGLETIFSDNSYFQYYSIVEGISLNQNNFLQINRKRYRLMTDFYPLNVSANGRVSGEIVKVGYGVKSDKLEYDDYENLTNLEGKIFVIEMGLPSELKDKMADELDIKVNTAAEKGAIAVIFINNGNAEQEPVLNDQLFRQPMSIPVIFAKGKALKTIMDATAPRVEFEVGIEKEINSSQNVVGYIDNQSSSTIVIGAHYDHLGMEEPNSSGDSEEGVFHGADDNASGVAVLLELAARFKCSGFNQSNVLFIAFGGEEKGLLGSSYFANSSDYNMEKINYMLNIDMVGRIDTTNSKIYIIGTGSSVVWDSIIDITHSDYFSVNKSQSVSGGSDHASFYQKDIPSLFFFSGLHNDYHKTSDVIGELNFNGLFSVSDYMYDFVLNTGRIEIPFFRVGTETNSGGRRPRNVSLGIVPDHAYEGSGLRISDIIDNKPAANAGLLRSDVIIKIGDMEINDIHTYMSVLNTYNKGDKAIVKVSRGDEILEFEVLF
ncbi:MAG: M20/M25/M40 family metallo-hydrolase [Bacteroidales bacterium]|nr:M20/M25/M40 family metallo-hydrolase [Bacteroidales bacterium]